MYSTHKKLNAETYMHHHMNQDSGGEQHYDAMQYVNNGEHHYDAMQYVNNGEHHYDAMQYVNNSEHHNDAMQHMEGNHLQIDSSMFSDPEPVGSIEQFSFFQELAEFERKVKKVFK